MTIGDLDDWERVRLGDVLQLRNGYAFKSTQWSTRGRPIIRIQNLNGRSLAYNHFDGDLPDRFAARPGDLLFAWSGTPGTSFGAHVWEGPEAWINQHIFRVDFSPELFDRDFLRLALTANLASYIDQAQGGVGLAHITKAKLNASLLVAPPISVQRRLAARMYAGQRLIESATANLHGAAALAERARQATLRRAFDWSLKSAGSHSAELGTLIREPLRNGYSARPVMQETPVRVLTLTATTSGVFDDTQFKYTDERFSEDSSFWVQPNDILVQRGNTAEYVGVPALYTGVAGAFIYPDLMIRVRPVQDLDPTFLWLMMLAPQSRDFLRQRASGSAGNMPKINQGTLASLPIPTPTPSQQAEIVAHVLQMTSGLDRVRATIQGSEAKLARAPALMLAKTVDHGSAA